ncbi:MAG: hypothetical protein GXY92_05040 [Syntrophomonadaceae bacterium]|nr:hypothetical protein [Syntrophomonadaceae bacterium]
MLLSFFGKEGNNNLDISVFMEYPPDIVLEFFQQSYVNISLSVYQELKDQFADPDNLNENIPKWVLFIDKLLDMEDSLYSLEENRNLDFVGPAYYIKTNTRFFFYKTCFEHEGITAQDIAEMVELNSTPAINDLIAKHYATLKCKPASRKSREELLNDLQVSISALEEIEHISRQIMFQRRLIEIREAFLNAPYAALIEPEKPEDKPEKPVPKQSFLGSIFNPKSRAAFEAACQQYNHDLKVYYIKYREYEKACDRYKNALRDWESEKNYLINRSIEDIKKAKLKIKKGNRIIKIYNEVLNSLDIHPQYQSIVPLTRFYYYLETGRAFSIQECMNLYEQELKLEELKESQERLERNIMATVYYLSSEAAATTELPPYDNPEELMEMIYKRWQAEKRVET